MNLESDKSARLGFAVDELILENGLGSDRPLDISGTPGPGN